MSIQHFEHLLHSLSTVSFGAETYYNLLEAFTQLKEIGENKIEIRDASITPFYVASGRRLELYAFELTLAVVPQKTPIEAYLRRRTGRSDLSTVDPYIISRLQHCYLEATTDDRRLTGNALAQYCSYLFSSEEIQREINSSLNLFHPSQLYFSYFRD